MKVKTWKTSTGVLNGKFYGGRKGDRWLFQTTGSESIMMFESLLEV